MKSKMRGNRTEESGMMTLRQFAEQPPNIPAATSWYLADVAQALGKQELFTKQAPQKLKALREHALIESAISSNRIEGVEVEKKRIGTIVFGKAALRDRDEGEVIADFGSHNPGVARHLARPAGRRGGIQEERERHH